MTMFFREAGFAIATAAALALTAVPANATYFGSRDGPAIGIGTSCAALMENVARNINQSDDLLALHREAASAILAFRHRGQRDVPQGIALYKAAQIDGIARQPGADALLADLSEECAGNLRALRPSRPDRAAVAIGEMCAALLDGVARQPEAETLLLAAYADGVEQIKAMGARSSSHVRAEALGIVKAAQITGVARQPEAAGRLASAAATCENDIRRN